MTEYEAEVRKQIELMKAEEWGKKVNYLLAEDGKTKLVLNNGDIQWTNNKTGKSHWVRSNPDKESLIDRFQRWRSDQASGYREE